jgi:hypothetical protein
MITVKIMKDHLCLHSQPTTGRKHEFAKQIVEFSELGTEMPVHGPLAATYNIEGGDDLDAGGDNESEIDARMFVGVVVDAQSLSTNILLM